MRLWFTPFILSLISLSALAQSARENYQDIINKAQNLTLQHERLQASRLLIRAIKTEKPNSLAAKNLKKMLTELSEIIYQEKTQRAYELAESMPDAKLSAAAEKYEEAAELEPGNVLLLKALARTKLRLQDCAGASKIVDQGLEVNPYSGELYLFKAQALQCLDQRDALKLILTQHQDILKAYRPYYDLVQLKDFVGQKKWLEAKRKTKEIEQIDPVFPERWRWAFEIGKNTDSPDLESGQKYVHACEKSLEALKRKYALEPALCLASKQIEKDLKTYKEEKTVEE